VTRISELAWRFPPFRSVSWCITTVGLLLGLLGLRPLGIAAAAGLVMFFAGALATHIRARVFYNIAVPGAFFALAAASGILAIAAR